MLLLLYHVSDPFLLSCPAVRRAATCRARVTVGTPWPWPRQSRSTMIPSTPCTSPEPRQQWLQFCPFSFSPLFLFFASLSLYLSLSLASWSAPKRFEASEVCQCSIFLFGKTRSGVPDRSRPLPAIRDRETVGFRCTEKTTRKHKLSHFLGEGGVVYFWMSLFVFKRYTEQLSGLTLIVSGSS